MWSGLCACKWNAASVHGIAMRSVVNNRLCSWIIIEWINLKSEFTKKYLLDTCDKCRVFLPLQICRELFESQSADYRSGVLDPNHVTFFIEAGVQRGWIGYFAGTSRAICLDRFGESAPGAVVAEKLGCIAWSFRIFY